MSSDVSPNFLLEMKSLFRSAKRYSQTTSRNDRRLAIHLSHYAVEQIMRERAKNHQFDNQLQKIGYEEILKKLNTKMAIPYFDRLIELDTMRNNAQHRGLIADQVDVSVHIAAAEDFLKWSYGNYFHSDYDGLREEDLIVEKSVREALLRARGFIDQDNLGEAAKDMFGALGYFKAKLFQFYTDPRTMGEEFSGVDMPNLFFENTLKILFSDDMYTLRRLLDLGAVRWRKQDDGNIVIYYEWRYPSFTSKDQAHQEYQKILEIILNYQDRFTFLQ